LYKKAEAVSKDGKGNLEDLIKQLKEGEFESSSLFHDATSENEAIALTLVLWCGLV